MGRTSGNVIGELTRVLRWGTATGDDDDRLLERFLADRDESAFTALVARHGPMVLGVCRRVLRDEDDVQDAFQATFLVLVRSAGAIRRGELVGPWIHGVAHRVAVRARAVAARRFVRERNGADVEALALAPAARGCDHAELRTILDAELARLPEALRAPLVLCYLEGLTHEQAAGRLRQPVGTIRSRLSRGRERLRTRLARRGVSADDAAWGSIVLAEPISPALFETTVRSALEFSVHHNTAAALVSATTAALAKGVLDAMLITKLQLAGACALGLVLTMGGVSGYALQQGPGQEKEKAKETPAVVAKSPEPTPADDANQKVLVRRLDAYITELEDQIRRKEADLKTMEMQLDLITRKRETVRRSLSTEPAGDRPPQAAPARRPAEVKEAAPVKPASAARIPSSSLGLMSGFDGQFGGGQAQLPYLSTTKMVIVASPDGHVVTGYSSETGEAKTIRLAEKGDPDLKVMPVLSPGFAALLIKGTKINRIAVFNSVDGEWRAQDLVEAATTVTPVVGPGMGYYTIGRRIYAFSALASRWDVLELPSEGEPVTRLAGEFISCQIGDRLHLFSVKTGKWTDIDTRAVSDEPKEDQGHAEKPTESVVRPSPSTNVKSSQEPLTPGVEIPGAGDGVAENRSPFEMDEKTKPVVSENAKLDGKEQPEYLPPDKPIVVTSPRGDVVTIFEIPDPSQMGMMMGMMMGRTGGGMGQPDGVMGGGPANPNAGSQSVRLAEKGDPSLDVTPVVGQRLITLTLQGEKIQKLAVFNRQRDRWDVQELREPVKKATPVSSMNEVMMVYALGRRLYTYSLSVGKWSVLELPEGARPKAIASDQGLTLKYGDKVYLYNAQSGKWADPFVLHAASKEPETPKETKGPQ